MQQISFGTSGWRATLDVFTDERLRYVAQAAATYLRELEGGDGRPVAVGYDARESSPEFARTVAEVLTDNGFDVVLPDRDCPTPTIAYAVLERGLAGALVITASHNPPEYNGVKFLTGDGVSAPPAVADALEANLAPPEQLSPEERGAIERFDPVPAHAGHSLDLVGSFYDTDLSGLRIVYDALHGSGRDVTDALLESAGAEVIRRRCSRDPEFGGTAPEPASDNLAELVTAVDRHDADVGIANDGDADRVAVCTPERGYLDGNHLFATLYEALLTGGGASGSAVRTVSTTALIDRIAEAHGETVHEVPVGFKWVAEAMDQHDALFGGEESGGYTVRGNVRGKDGVLIALLIGAITAAEPLDARLDRLVDTYGGISTDKESVDCPDERKADVLGTIERQLPDHLAGLGVERVGTLDGVKLFLEDGSWLLVRPSGTEPKLRIYVESPHDERVKPVLEAGEAFVDDILHRY